MYAPAHFADDETAGLATVRDFPFAMLVTQGGDGAPAVTHMPMLLASASARPALLGHFARANPHASAFRDGDKAVAVFSGPNGYISPNWYPSKHAGAEAVPTWNYVAAHVTGVMRLLPDIADKRRVVADLSRRFEGDGPGAWRLDDEPEDFVRRMLGGIVAFALEIETVEAKAKLSQNRSASDRAGVIEGLRGADRPDTRGLADVMAARDASQADA